MAHALNFIADFGEAVVLVPAALVVALWLAIAGQRQWLVAWLATLFFVIGMTIFLRTPAIWPSGHVAASLAFYGGVAVLAWRAIHPQAPLLALALSLLIALFPLSVTIAIVILRWHGFRGVSLGILLGAITPIALALMPQRRDVMPYALPMLIATAAVVAVLHGTRLNYTNALVRIERAW